MLLRKGKLPYSREVSHHLHQQKKTAMTLLKSQHFFSENVGYKQLQVKSLVHILRKSVPVVLNTLRKNNVVSAQYRLRDSPLPLLFVFVTYLNF